MLSRSSSILAFALIALLAAFGAVRLRHAPAPLQINHGITSAPQSQQAPPPPRTLIIIVPGTHGNEGFWPVISPGQATFGSELQRGAGVDVTDVYPFLWSAPNEQAPRLAAARNLADVIDRHAPGHARICLVGHSYGGDVALWAAGLCKSRVDLVLCLSTPHLYLSGKTPAGDVQLPVYCTAEARRNVRKILAICPDVDRVPDVWADLRKGVDENDAIHLAAGWLESTGFPRLKADGWMHDMGLSDNLELTRKLNVADDNVEYLSQVDGPLQPHYCVHSRRMGYILGALIARGGDDRSIAYLRTTLQPAGADWGEPIPAAEHEAWLRAHADRFQDAGHALRHVDVKLWGRDASVDPYLKLCSADGKNVLAKTHKESGRHAFFKMRWLLMKDQSARIDLWDARLFGDAYLGNAALNGATTPPAFVRHEGDKDQWSWSARMDWVAIHQ